MKQVYNDGTYFDNNPTWHEKDSPWKAGQIKEIIKKNGLDPKRICEIGCGAGEILNQLAMEYKEKEFYGYEISPQAFELCKKRTKSNLTFFLQDLLEENSEYFDVVMAIDVIEHIEDYFGFLRRLKDKAEFKIFHIPLDLSVQMVLRSSPILKVRKQCGHIHYYTKETALEALRDTGYEIVDYFYTSGSLNLPDQGWKSNLLKIPRRLLFSVNKDLTCRILGGFSLMILAK